MVMTARPASFVWYDLLTSRPNVSNAFYRSVLGWNLADAGLADRSYMIASAGAVPVGGILAAPGDPMAAGRKLWMGHIGVEDLDASLARLTAAGGAVYRTAEDIPGVGRFAVVGDPQRAAFILFQPRVSMRLAPMPPGTPGHIGWHELYTDDLTGAWEFYAGLFGWTKADALDMGSLGTYQMFAAGGAPIGGMMIRPPEFPQPAWVYYVNVTDIDAAVARVRDHGGTVLFGPREVPGGSRIAQCTDPLGTLFALVAARR